MSQADKLLNMKNQTLLEKAKAVPIRKARSYDAISDEEMEVVFGWLRDEVKTKQICFVLGHTYNTGNVLYFIAIALRKAYREGRLKIVE